MALASAGQSMPCSASQMSPMPSSSRAIHWAHGYEKRASAFGFCWGQNSRTSAMSDGLLSICPLRRVLTLSDDCHVIVTLRHDIEYKIGRASCRERVCKEVLISGGGGSLKK